MASAEKFFLLALESATDAQLEELVAIAEDKGVPLAELIEEAINCSKIRVTAPLRIGFS
jgi:hypothetical protein